MFSRTWNEILSRHSILRTAFLWEELDEPSQVVRRKLRLPVAEQDWRHHSFAVQQKKLEAYLVEERRRGFNLAKAPLMRLSLLRISDSSFFFVWTFHHLLLDGWSVSLLNRELVNIYETFFDGQPYYRPAPLPYKHYIAWLRQQDPSKSETF